VKTPRGKGKIEKRGTPIKKNSPPIGKIPTVKGERFRKEGRGGKRGGQKEHGKCWKGEDTEHLRKSFWEKES